jgi:hypothetical protein
MLRRIQTQLGINPEDLDSPDNSIPTGAANGLNEQTPPTAHLTLGGVGTTSSSERYSNDSNNDIGPSVHDFADFGMVDRNLVPVSGIQQDVNMVDTWGIPQMQNGYDWVGWPSYFSFILVLLWIPEALGTLLLTACSVFY